MTARFIGPLTVPGLPEQPTFEAWCTLWTAYDVPRIWDVVSGEDDQNGWTQVLGFDRLATLLEDQARRLISQREAMANAWTSPAASAMLSRVDTLTITLLSDALCAATTARGLHGVMETLATAKSKVSVMERSWGQVTTDWKPEWWDHAAADLNRQAQKVMSDADLAIRDHRTNIIIPDLAKSGLDHSFSPGPEGSPQPTTPTRDRSTDQRSGIGAHAVPPMPGYQPASWSDTSGDSHSGGTGPGGGLTGGPGAVPARPGQPVSVLPIPPGSPYAPGGGAYILPGPGVGAGGYIVARPVNGNGGVYYPAGAGKPALGTSRMGGGPNGGGVGMYPAPFGVGNPQARGESNPGHRRAGDTVWEVRQGVPPVIRLDDDPSNAAAEAGEKDFKDWFTDLATPWRKSSSNAQVTIRRAAS